MICSGNLTRDLRGLKLTGGERLMDLDRRAGESEEEDEDDEVDSTFFALQESSRFASKHANTLLEPDPAPMELSVLPRDPLGE